MIHRLWKTKVEQEWINAETCGKFSTDAAWPSRCATEQNGI
jgi:hypothetical protein